MLFQLRLASCYMGAPTHLIGLHMGPCWAAPACTPESTVVYVLTCRANLDRKLVPCKTLALHFYDLSQVAHSGRLSGCLTMTAMIRCKVQRQRISSHAWACRQRRGRERRGEIERKKQLQMLTNLFVFCDRLYKQQPPDQRRPKVSLSL